MRLRFVVNILVTVIERLFKDDSEYLSDPVGMATARKLQTRREAFQFPEMQVADFDDDELQLPMRRRAISSLRQFWRSWSV